MAHFGFGNALRRFFEKSLRGNQDNKRLRAEAEKTLTVDRGEEDDTRDNFDDGTGGYLILREVLTQGYSRDNVSGFYEFERSFYTPLGNFIPYAYAKELCTMSPI